MLKSIYRNNKLLFCLLTGLLATTSFSQDNDSGIVNDSTVNNTDIKLNQDAIYGRPTLGFKKLPVVVGGYIEANSIFTTVDGVSEGLSFQARRLTLFTSGSINKRIKFLSEIEFEEGGREINIEFAAVDVAFHPILNLRGGFIINPIGAFNQNHDGPKWEFVERPDVGVNLLPATWTNPGFGFYGKVYKKDWAFGYEAYLTNGFDESIIDNTESRTYLPAIRETGDRFEESSNGVPLFTGKLAVKNNKFGEIGFSYVGGVYNNFEIDGLRIDRRRSINIAAVDINTTIKPLGTKLVGEAAFISVDVPTSLGQQFGDKQWGAFLDIVQPVIQREILDWEEAAFFVSLRINYVDWNVGTFNDTNTSIGDDLFALTPAISFRPNSQTVFRLNYRYQWQTDIINNPAARSASWLLGLSTYF